MFCLEDAFCECGFSKNCITFSVIRITELKWWIKNVFLKEKKI